MGLYLIIPWLQLIGVAIPLLGCLALFKKEPTKASMSLLLTNVGCLFINSIYLLMLGASTEAAVLMANKILYMANTLFYFSFMLFVATYLDLGTQKLRTSILSVWVVVELAFLFNLFIGDPFHVVFLEINIQRLDKWGINLVQTIPSVLFMVRNCILCIMLLAGMLVSIVRMFKVRAKEERNNLARLVGAQFVIVVALHVRLLYVFFFDIVPLSAALSILAISLGVIRGNFFYVTDRGRDWVIEHTDNALIIVDNQYGFLDANPVAKGLYPALIKLEKSERIPEEVINLFYDSKHCVNLKEKHYEKEIETITQKNKTIGYSMLLIDNTEHYQLMEQIEAEKKRAEDANKAKSAFMSNMSHEIRTPMNAIVGMTEILLREDLPASTREYLNNIRSSGDALLTIINDILDFSKIEAGKLDIVEHEYEPMSMLKDLYLIFLNRIGEKEIELIYDIDPNLPEKLYGDSKRIRQILINLMNNAVKFTEIGYVKLKVKVEFLDEENINIVYSVQDTGQGIKEEDIGQLFGTYAQVDKEKNHFKEGTGLGLSISKQIVELMGGTIGVDSQYGKGSTFYFTIPQRVCSQKKAVWTNEKEEDALCFMAPKAQILIVDDHEMNLKVAKGLLAPLGMQIDMAENGKEAVDKICKKDYDLVFMDHMMPVMDGIEAIRVIRSLEEDRLRTLPVVALTANATNEARELFSTNGFSDFIAKPIKLKELCACIRKWLPAELIVTGGLEISKSEESTELSELVIEGLDVQEGIQNCGNRELFISLLGDFYKLIDQKSAKIEKYLEEGLLREYTIEVHALKSTARMIGAMELSEKFYRLEQLGNAQDEKALIIETPEVLSLYRSYKAVLQPFACMKEQQKKDVPVEDILRELENLASAIDAFDLDGADEAMHKLEGFSFPEGQREKVEELSAYVADVAMEDVIRIANELVIELQNG